MSEPTRPTADVPIACSLSAADLGDRLAQWRRLLADATPMASADGPSVAVVQLGAETSVSEVAALCADEVACCPFFTFDITIGAAGPRLRIAVPDGAETILSSLLGR